METKMRGRIESRLAKLELGVPNAAEQQELHERIERAHGRIMATMTEDERAAYIAERAARAERASQGGATSGQRGRFVSLAERLRAARNPG